MIIALIAAAVVQATPHEKQLDSFDRSVAQICRDSLLTDLYSAEAHRTNARTFSILGDKAEHDQALREAAKADRAAAEIYLNPTCGPLLPPKKKP